GAVLRLHDGVQVAGEDLKRLFERARVARHAMQPLIRKIGSAKVVEQAAIAGALSPEVLSSPERAAAAEYVARRLDLLEPEAERGWQGAAEPDGGISFSRRQRGLTERYVIDAAAIRSAEAHRLDAMAAELQATYE